MIDHVQGGAGLRCAVIAKMPRMMNPKWEIDVYAIRRITSCCPIARIAPYRMPTTASAAITERNTTPRRKQLQTEPQHRKGSHLVDDRHHQHRARRGGGDGGVGQPGMERLQQGLHGECEQETEEQDFQQARSGVEFPGRGGICDRGQVEGAADVGPGGDHVRGPQPRLA